MGKPASRSGSRARRQPRKQLRPCRRDAASARRESCVDSFLSNPSNVFLCSHSGQAKKNSFWHFHSCYLERASIPKLNPITASEFENILNGNCRWLSWSDRFVRCRNRRRFQKLFEPSGREHDEIMISDVTRVAESVGDIARGDESLARFQPEDLLADNGFQFAGDYKQCFILARVRMA